MYVSCLLHERMCHSKARRSCTSCYTLRNRLRYGASCGVPYVTRQEDTWLYPSYMPAFHSFMPRQTRKNDEILKLTYDAESAISSFGLVSAPRRCFKTKSHNVEQIPTISTCRTRMFWLLASMRAWMNGRTLQHLNRILQNREKTLSSLSYQVLFRCLNGNQIHVTQGMARILDIRTCPLRHATCSMPLARPLEQAWYFPHVMWYFGHRAQAQLHLVVVLR